MTDEQERLAAIGAAWTMLDEMRQRRGWEGIGWFRKPDGSYRAYIAQGGPLRPAPVVGDGPTFPDAVAVVTAALEQSPDELEAERRFADESIKA